jgi:transposase InsO family protein
VAPKAVTVEQRRFEVIMAPRVLGITVMEACRRFDISRQQFYEWRRRFDTDGLAGLSDRSHRPRSSPRQVGEETERAICVLRVGHPHWGPRRIRAELMRRGGLPPAKSTVQRVLERNGLVSPRPRSKRTYVRFERPCPNDLWQIDAIEVELRDRSKAYTVNILDDHARLLLSSRACGTIDFAAAWDAFEAASSAWGLPRELLSDNALSFSGLSRGHVAEFERRLWSLGVRTIAITPRHPQTIGKVERMHRTMRGWLGRRPTPTTLAQLQRLLDAFRWHYNEQRPNQAIGDATPAERYRATPPAVPSGEETQRRTHRKVRPNGTFHYSGWVVGLSSEWSGAAIEIIEQGGKVRAVFGDELITSFSTEEPKGYIRWGSHSGKVRKRRRIEG